jgi:hypothetical protein
MSVWGRLTLVSVIFKRKMDVEGGMINHDADIERAFYEQFLQTGCFAFISVHSNIFQ